MKYENNLGISGLLCDGNFIAGQWQYSLGGEHITLHNASEGSDLAAASALAALPADWGKLTATDHDRVLYRIEIRLA